MEKTGTTENMFYIHPDYLGSVHLVTNASGNVVQELSYDAWGRQRNATDWTYNGTLPEPKFERGYTFHEQLTEFDLINMNGRVYDPFIARFMSPDPFTQDPGNLQGYNRYSYVLNNPMKYVDPSGYTYAEFMMQNNSYEGGNFYYRGREYFYDSGSGGFYGHGGEYLGEAGYYYDYESRSYMHNGNPVNEGEAIGSSLSNDGGTVATFLIYETGYLDDNKNFIGNGNYGVICAGIMESTGKYPDFTLGNGLDLYQDNQFLIDATYVSGQNAGYHNNKKNNEKRNIEWINGGAYLYGMMNSDLTGNTLYRGKNVTISWEATISQPNPIVEVFNQLFSTGVYNDATFQDYNVNLYFQVNWPSIDHGDTVISVVPPGSRYKYNGKYYLNKSDKNDSLFFYK